MCGQSNDRAGLVDDAFSLADANVHPYTQVCVLESSIVPGCCPRSLAPIVLRGPVCCFWPPSFNSRSLVPVSYVLSVVRINQPTQSAILAFAYPGSVGSEQGLNMSRFLERELQYPVWESGITHLSKLNTLLVPRPFECCTLSCALQSFCCRR